MIWAAGILAFLLFPVAFLVLFVLALLACCWAADAARAAASALRRARLRLQGKRGRIPGLEADGRPLTAREKRTWDDITGALEADALKGKIR